MAKEKKLIFVLLFSILILSLVGFVYADNFGTINKTLKENSKIGEFFQNSTKLNSSQGDLGILGSKSKINAKKDLEKEGEKKDNGDNSVNKENKNNLENKKEKENKNNLENKKEKEIKNKFKNENETEYENESEHFFVKVNGTEKEIKIRTKISDGEINKEVEFEGYNISSKLGLNITYENKSKEIKMRVNLSNGKEKEIKILPNVASQTAINVFKNKNITVELKEVKEGNSTSVVYEASLKKQVKLFGLFNVIAPLKTQIDSETGKVINLNKPWWYFLVFGSSGINDISTSNETINASNVTTNSTTANGSI